jgi:outer membrane protein assembly factor BamA
MPASTTSPRRLEQRRRHWYSPGPPDRTVRIDYGIPIKADEFNDSSGKFNFNIGYQF